MNTQATCWHMLLNVCSSVNQLTNVSVIYLFFNIYKCLSVFIKTATTVNSCTRQLTENEISNYCESRLFSASFQLVKCEDLQRFFLLKGINFGFRKLSISYNFLIFHRPND